MIGSNLSHYHIDEELGRGGMGIVYRATDTKLDRVVAIKVLPPHALTSEEDRARFYREAKSAAQLHHPNIATVFQVDEVEVDGTPRPFIAMEYIDGEALADRIGKGPLKLGEAIRVATEIAEALKAAHAKDIVHRDIKSQNVMLTRDGVAKVLDSGLAKTNASTMLTRQGSTMGTVAYMSPEQACGEEVDGRTDLYALGTVLYEMVAGRLPFGGDYEQAVLYAILNEEPEPLTALRTGVPMEMERITGKLLAKDRSYRYQTAADLLADLGALNLAAVSHHSMRPAGAPSIAPQPSARPDWPWISGAVLLGILGLFAGRWSAPTPPPRPVERLSLTMDGMRMITFVSISPDSRYLAFTGYDWAGNEGMFLHSIETGTTAHVDRSGGALYPWFSPSGSRLAFSSLGNEGVMRVMDVPSGSPEAIVQNAWTSYWLDEDRILYTQDQGDNSAPTPIQGSLGRGPNYIYSFSADSSVLVSGTERALDGAEWFFPGPRLPESPLSLGNVQGAASYGIDPHLYILDTRVPSVTETEVGGINVQPLTADIIVYQLGDDAGKLVARRVDPSTGRVVSPPVDVKASTFFGRFQAEPNSGSIVFAPDHLPDQPLVSIFDLNTGALSFYDISGTEGEISSLSISRDGREVIGAVTSGETGLSRLVTIDMNTGQVVTRAEDVSYLGLERLSDGRFRTLNYSIRNDLADPNRFLAVQPATGRGDPDTLSAPFLELEYAATVDDGFLVATGGEIGLLDRTGQRFTPYAPGRAPSASPDGRYIAFESPGGVMAIYDRLTDQVVELLGLRGNRPAWGRDGRYLYFFSSASIPEGAEGSEADLVRVKVSLAPRLEVIADPEFILHTYYPVRLSVGDGRIALLTNGDVSVAPPERRSVRIEWWRNVAKEIEAMLP